MTFDFAMKAGFLAFWWHTLQDAPTLAASSDSEPKRSTSSSSLSCFDSIFCEAGHEAMFISQIGWA